MVTGGVVQELTGRDRLIVALDLPTADEALAVVDELDNVSFFKVGWQLFMSGEILRLLERLQEKSVFVDLKVPGDIGNTIRSVVEQCARLNVKFLTLSESAPLATIRAAKAARGASRTPQLLTVPYLSSLDAGDLPDVAPGEKDLETYILTRARSAVDAGCDGVIASGNAIRICRSAFSRSIVIVSPGIRPAGASTDDHKRHTTPSEAIRLGADYLVVGRPILKSPDKRVAAQQIIDEIDSALAAGDVSASSAFMGSTQFRGHVQPHAV
jgi:orotidine-5'-phosphate decarboxylase